MSDIAKLNVPICAGGWFWASRAVSLFPFFETAGRAGGAGIQAEAGKES